MDNVCIDCKESEVFNIKRRLCKKCYHRHYWHGRKKDGKTSKEWGPRINYSSEIEFAKNFFNHKNYIYHPAIFRLNGTTYEPDFYDGERNCFIEVSARRQAFHENKLKYLSFNKIYPMIKLEIRKITGELFPTQKDRTKL